MKKAIIMGVAGCGKTSVGSGLAQRLQASYLDGDDLHPPGNVEKMSAGIALNDADRLPWLALVGQRLAAESGPVLIACSALKRHYRDIIRGQAGEPIVFIHLHGSREVIEQRMSNREGHFMPVNLIDSQFAALEPLQADETGFVVTIEQSLERVVAEAIEKIRKESSWQ